MSFIMCFPEIVIVVFLGLFHLILGLFGLILGLFGFVVQLVQMRYRVYKLRKAIGPDGIIISINLGPVDPNQK